MKRASRRIYATEETYNALLKMKNDKKESLDSILSRLILFYQRNQRIEKQLKKLSKLLRF